MLTTKEIIIEKAAHLFAKKGYAGTSISMIAKEVGVTKSAFYAHFDSKDEVMGAIIDRYGPASVINRVKQLDFVGLKKSPRKVFSEMMMDVVLRFTDKDNRIFMNLVRMGVVGLSRQGKGYSLRDVIDKSKEEGGQIIASLQEAGIMKQKYPAQFLAWELLAPIVHVRLMLFSLEATRKDLDLGIKMCRKHIEYFMDNNFEGNK